MRGKRFFIIVAMLLVVASVAGILTRTREDVFRKTQDPTALAYVFYDDPKLTLRKPQQ